MNKFICRSEIIIMFSLAFALFNNSNSLMAQAESDSLVFIHVTDTHITDFDGYHPELRKNRRIQYEDNYSAFEKFLNTVPNQTGADEIIITGDITDFYAGEAIDGELKAGQIEKFITLYEKSPVPIYMTIGNHEISTYYSKESKVEDNKTGGRFNAEIAKSTWIKKVKCFDKGIYYSRKINVGGTKYLFLFLDVSYKLPTESEDVFWDPQMLEWLEYELAENNNSQSILFFHMPIALNCNEEVTNAELQPDASNLSSMIKILEKYESVKALFVGHKHENWIKNLCLPNGNVIPQIETGGFGEDEKNWRVVKVKPDVIEISYTGETNIERKIEIK